METFISETTLQQNCYENLSLKSHYNELEVGLKKQGHCIRMKNRC